MQFILVLLFVNYLQRRGSLLFVGAFQLRGSLDDISTAYNDIHNWSLYERPGLLKADTTTAHSEKSGFHYYATLLIFITGTHT